jgi:alpha-mannosidase
LNQPLLAREVKADLDSSPIPQPRWQLELVPATSSVLPSGLKMAYDRSGCTLRFYESAGQNTQITLRGLPEHGRLWETTLVEERLERLEPQDGELALTFRPWQVRTFLLEHEQENQTRA